LESSSIAAICGRSAVRSHDAMGGVNPRLSPQPIVSGTHFGNARRSIALPNPRARLYRSGSLSAYSTSPRSGLQLDRIRAGFFSGLNNAHRLLKTHVGDWRRLPPR